LRVLLVTEQYRTSRSGVGTYARGLVEGLRAAGHEVVLLVSETEAPEDAGFPVVPFRSPPGNITVLNRKRRSRILAPAVAAAREGCDVVHFLDARWAMLAGPLSPGTHPVHTVGTVHDSYALDWQAPEFPRSVYADRWRRAWHYRWLRAREAESYGRLDRLLANSDHVARRIREGYSLADDDVEVVRIGVPPVTDAAEPEALAGDPSILFVGTNFTRKGLLELFGAIAVLRKEVPGIHLHIAGGDGRIDLFRELVTREGLNGHVTLAGIQSPDRIQAMMAGADVFAMPSHVEAWGLVYLEAMRHGCAVVATAAGGIGESFADGREIRLVPPVDTNATAAILRDLAGDPDARRKLGEAGRAAAARFTVEATAAETVAVYEALG